MRAPVSVIVPTLNAEALLPGCVAALYEGLEAGVIRELIVVDGGSLDATVTIAHEVGAQLVVLDAPSRGAQLAAGARAASGEWLMFVHADTCLAPGWSSVVTAHLQVGYEVGSGVAPVAGYFCLRFDQQRIAARIVAGWANLRSRLFGLPYGDQGLLVSRVQYESVGGYPEIPLMEDVAMARALRGRLTRLRSDAVTSAAAYQAQGWWRRGARNLWTLARYFGGVSPERLAQGYRR